jgi:hypothetical protein
MTVRVDVGLLHHIFGFGLIPDNGAGRTVEPLVVASHQDFEKRRLTRKNTSHHLLVREQTPTFQNRRAYNVHHLSAAGLSLNRVTNEAKVTPGRRNAKKCEGV